MLEEEVPTELKVLLTLNSTWTSLSKHTTEDPAPSCLSRRHIAKMIYFKLWVLYFHIKIRAQTCYQSHSGNGISKLENLWEISQNPSLISRFSSPKIRFSSYEIQFIKIGFLLSFSAFCFLQRLSAFSNGFLIFFNGFPLSPTAFRISTTAFQFSSTAFRFPRNPGKSIYGKKYTKFCYSSFVFFATCSPSIVLPAKQYLRLTQQSHCFLKALARILLCLPCKLFPPDRTLRLDSSWSLPPPLDAVRCAPPVDVGG